MPSAHLSRDILELLRSSWLGVPGCYPLPKRRTKAGIWVAWCLGHSSPLLFSPHPIMPGTPIRGPLSWWLRQSPEPCLSCLYDPISGRMGDKRVGELSKRTCLTNTEHMFAVSRMWHFLYPHRATKFSPVSFGCMPNRSFIQWFTVHQTLFWVLCPSAVLYCTVVWGQKKYITLTRSGS